MKLTEFEVKSLRKAEKVYRVSDGANLYLEVRPSGGKHWRYVFATPGGQKGQKTMRSLGSWPVVTVKRAREKALALAREIEAGTLAPKAEAPTFGAIAEEYFAGSASLKANTPKEIARKDFLLERYISPELGPLPAASVQAGFILEKVLRPLEAQGLLVTARKVKSLISMIYDFAAASGKVPANPAQNLPRGALAPARTTHYPAITDPPEVGGLMLAIDSYEGKPAVAGALKLLPLVFVRPGELRNARWEEINLEGATWSIPAGRMKMKAPHIVPLSRQAVEILSGLRESTGGGPLVFPGMRSAARPISDVTLNAALRRLDYSSKEICAHGFRAMASTLLNGELGFSPDVIEKQLAHGERNAVRAAYNHADYLPERRRMMQRWADYLDELREKRRSRAK
jgi:integrase